MKSLNLGFSLVAAYPNDPSITINSPTADAKINGVITFSGSAIDRNSPTQPSAKDVSIRVVQGGNTWWPSPIQMDGNNWSATWDSAGKKGAMTVHVSARSERLNKTETVSRNFTIWYPNQPEVSWREPAWGSLYAVNNYAILRGNALDRNAASGYGISAVHLYRVNDNGTETHLGQAWYNHATSEWQFDWKASAVSTATFAAMTASEGSEAERTLVKGAETETSLAKQDDGEVIVYVDDDWEPGDDPWDPEPEPDPVYYEKTITLRVKCVSAAGVWSTGVDRQLRVYWYA